MSMTLPSMSMLMEHGGAIGKSMLAHFRLIEMIRGLVECPSAA